jgi:hypothetical protein
MAIAPWRSALVGPGYVRPNPGGRVFPVIDHETLAVLVAREPFEVSIWLRWSKVVNMLFILHCGSRSQRLAGRASHQVLATSIAANKKGRGHLQAL